MRLKTKLEGALGVAALLMAFGAQEAGATLLLPGTAVTPSAGVLPTSAILATITDPFVIPGEMTGTVKTTVYAPDASNPYLGLTFTYDIHITSATATYTFQNLGLDGWSGFLSDAQQFGAGKAADNANRDAIPNADGIHFNFNTPATGSELASGDSATLVLQTGALSYKPSNYGAASTLTDNGNSYAPAETAVPDGSLTVALLGIGILGLGVFRKTVSA